ncbi:MAG TPA: zinc-dependent metalloprotease [Thermoleophilaceae bacterium]|nr:zinc-dependent metalloprotease [Thermoleophilaceae bacterium]
MVDWGVAERVARLAARSDDVPDLGVDLQALAAAFEPRVSAYTGLTPAEAVPRPEIVSRQGWAEANLGAMAELMSPVEERMQDRFSQAGPLAGPLRSAAGMALAGEIGLVVGYLSQRVLGQYELSLLAGTTRPRLLFVGTNLLGVAELLNVDRDAFIRWVAVHEMTHAMQFGGVPWLRDHMGSLLREYLETVDVKLDSKPEEPGDAQSPEPRNGARQPFPGRSGGLLGGALERLRGLDLPDPTDLVERFRDGGIAALVQTEEQRGLMDRMQAAMAVVEGHAEHVMDALAPELVPQHEGLRAAMDARRNSRSAPERVLMRLLGMEMKMRQYKLGKAFCDAVVAQGGIELLNHAWTGPESLPTLAEIERPDDWVVRVRAVV